MQEKVFRTKSGYCHLLPDRIILTRSGVVGNLAETVVGSNSIYRVLILWLGIAVFSVVMGYDYYQQGNEPVATMFFVITGYLLVSIIASRKNSATPVIMRDSIISVSLNKGLPGLTRARFIVTYKDEKDRELKRLILLKGTLKKNKGEIEKAEEMMRAEGLIS